MTEENIINNRCLSIVDTAILGKGTDTQNAVNDVLNSKIMDIKQSYKDGMYIMFW